MKAQVVDREGVFCVRRIGGHGALCYGAGTEAHYSPSASFILKHIAEFYSMLLITAKAADIVIYCS
jgi:hypothetical protein